MSTSLHSLQSGSRKITDKTIVIKVNDYLNQLFALGYNQQDIMAKFQEPCLPIDLRDLVDQEQKVRRYVQLLLTAHLTNQVSNSTRKQIKTGTEIPINSIDYSLFDLGYKTI